jgi:hypothetical protein
MRITCPHCRGRFDVAHAAVLDEARKLAEKAHGGKLAGPPLDEEDEAAARERAERIQDAAVGKVMGRRK